MSDPAAAPYADALYGAALDLGRGNEDGFASQRIEAVGRDLTDVVRALVENPQLTAVLFNPAIPPATKRRILGQLTLTADQLVRSALGVLLDHGRLGLLPDVQQAYEERYAREHGQIDVQLTTAVPIDDEQAEAVRHQLERATGQTVNMRRIVDPAILGGVVLRVRDQLLDASVRRRLTALRRSLKNTRLPA